MSKSVVRRAIVTPDKHFPLADKKAISCLCQAIEIVKPDIYVDLGDVENGKVVLTGNGEKRKDLH